MKDIISVIVPVYNVEPYLRHCLDSIVNQTYNNLEVIIIDDGSPDSCGAICDEYAARDNRLIVKHKKNGGLSAAWNDGMRIATGKWLAFVDSDDWLDTDYFENIIRSAESMGMEDADIIIAGGRFDEKGELSVAVRSFETPVQFRTAEERETLKERIHLCQAMDNGERLSYTGFAWGKLYRLSFLQNSHLRFDEALRGCQDLLLNFQAFDEAKNIIGCSYPATGGCYHYRFVANGITRQYTPKRPIMWHDYLSKLCEYIISTGERTPNDAQIIHYIAIRSMIESLNAYYFHPMNPDSLSEKRKKINEMKRMPIYREALLEKSNPYLTNKMKIYKALLKLPSILPLFCLILLKGRVTKR